MANKASAQPAEEVAEATTQTGEEYTTRGQTRLATPRGYRFRPSDQDLPEITPAGELFTADKAEEVLEESKRANGRVFKVENKEG